MPVFGNVYADRTRVLVSHVQTAAPENILLFPAVRMTNVEGTASGSCLLMDDCTVIYDVLKLMAGEILHVRRAKSIIVQNSFFTGRKSGRNCILRFEQAPIQFAIYQRWRINLILVDSWSTSYSSLNYTDASSYTEQFNGILLSVYSHWICPVGYAVHVSNHRYFSALVKLKNDRRLNNQQLSR